MTEASFNVYATESHGISWELHGPASQDAQWLASCDSLKIALATVAGLTGPTTVVGVWTLADWEAEMDEGRDPMEREEPSYLVYATGDRVVEYLRRADGSIYGTR